MNEIPEWRREGKRETLWYLGYSLAYFQPDDDRVGIRVTTRAYSRAPLTSRIVATEEGARRYANAWMAKWGAQAMAEVRNDIVAAEVARRPATGLDGLGRPYPEITATKRPNRKSRK